MLAIQHLTKYYDRLCAVNDLSFSVHPGEIVGLLGPNGAGKTTVLRCIAGILRPTSGRVEICGSDLATKEQSAKRALAFVPELPNLYDLLTVTEHVRFVAAAYDTEEELVHLEALLRRFELWEKRNELAATLSKGMRQKLACACAFSHRARVFCLDEPLIGIDPRGARELKAMLAERRDAGGALLVSTHMLDTAERLCDRVVILNHGQMVAEGTLAELTARARAGEGAECAGADDRSSPAPTAGLSTLEDVFLRLTEEKPA